MDTQLAWLACLGMFLALSRMDRNKGCFCVVLGH